MNVAGFIEYVELIKNISPNIPFYNSNNFCDFRIANSEEHNLETEREGEREREIFRDRKRFTYSFSTIAFLAVSLFLTPMITQTVLLIFFKIIRMSYFSEVHVKSAWWQLENTYLIILINYNFNIRLNTTPILRLCPFPSDYHVLPKMIFWGRKFFNPCRYKM